MKSIFPLVLIVAAIGLLYFEVRPMYNEVQVLRAESADFTHALELAQELGTLRNQLEDKLESFSQNDLKRLDHFLPQQLDTVRIILDIDGIGVRNGIELNQIQVAAATAPTKSDPKAPKVTAHQAVDVSFDFKATYPQAIALIKDLEQSLRLLDSMSVDVKPEKEGSPLYIFNVKLKTYWINR